MSVWNGSTAERNRTAPTSRARIRFWPELGVLLVYLALAAVYTRPLLESSQTQIAGEPGDPILNTSILWWNATVVPFTDIWWNPPYFHLTRDVGAFTENLTGLGPVATPLYWLTRNPLATHNITLFLTWPLSAFAVYLLVRALTFRRDAAFLAGLVFGFNPYRMAEMGHLQMVASFYFPLALLGLHGYLRDRRMRWLALFGAAWLLQSLTNGYLMLFGAVFIGLWIAYFCSARETWRALPAIGAAWMIASLPLVPVMMKYRAVHEYYGLRRALTYFPGFSVGAHAWVEVTDFIWVWRRLLPDGDHDLFPGLTAVLLVAVGAVVSVRLASREDRSEDGRLRIARRALGLVIALSAIAIVITLFAGPWRLSLGPVVLRVSDLDRALIVAAACGLAFVIVTRWARRAVARRSPLVFYAAAIVLMAALSCGPLIMAGDAIILDFAPYYWLMGLPGFSGLRVPTRFWMLGILSLAVAAGLAFTSLPFGRGRGRWLAFAIAAMGILADGWLQGMPMAVAPELLPALEPPGRTEPIAELPLGPGRDAAATFRSIAHRRPVFNGVSGYDPAHYMPLRTGLSERDPEMLRAMATFGPFDVVVDGAADAGTDMMRYVAGYPGAVRVMSDGIRTLFRLPAEEKPHEVGPALPIAAAAAFKHDPSPIVDGRPETEWGDQPQRPGQWVSVDLGAVREVGGVSHGLGEYARDFPRRLAIELSIDGVSWDRVWEGRTVAHSFRAAVVAPRAAMMQFTFTPRPARFVRLQQLAEHFHLWRVADVQVHSPAR